MLNRRSLQMTTGVLVSSLVILIVITMCPILVRMVQQLTDNIQKYALRLAEQTLELNREKQRNETLLYQMLPKPVADQLKEKGDATPEFYKQVTVFFSEIVGFDHLNGECKPIDIVSMLNTIYLLLDQRIMHHEVYKVETIGDLYMVVSGPCMAGVVGLKLPCYCLFGDTINTASQMETSGLPNHIHCSCATHKLLKKTGVYLFNARGSISIKGKGMMATYFLLSHTENPKLSEMQSLSTDSMKPSPHEASMPEKADPWVVLSTSQPSGVHLAKKKKSIFDKMASEIRKGQPAKEATPNSTTSRKTSLAEAEKRVDIQKPEEEVSGETIGGDAGGNDAILRVTASSNRPPSYQDLV